MSPTFRTYRWNGQRVTAAEFGEGVADLLADGWTLTPPTSEALTFRAPRYDVIGVAEDQPAGERESQP